VATEGVALPGRLLMAGSKSRGTRRGGGGAGGNCTHRNTFFNNQLANCTSPSPIARDAVSGPADFRPLWRLVVHRRQFRGLRTEANG
jgi:hypothetical protein